MDIELFNKICKDVEDRKEWATRQPLWYKIRKEGVRRRNKPWPHASDKHYPLVDMGIAKSKPAYLNQLFAQERIAEFTAADPESAQDITNVSWWFDYKVRQESNTEEEMDLVVDFMCLYGRGVIKAYWDIDEKKICCDAIEPIFIIVPDGTKDIRKCEYLVHVQHLTEWDYKNGKNKDLYNQDPDFVKKIIGGQEDASGSGDEDFERQRRLSEGITYSDDKDLIIIWEIYDRTDGKCVIHTISPACPEESIRDDFENPYKPDLNPFVDFPFEKIGKSFYSSRGIAELGAAFESYLCKTWNGKSDAIDLYNNPPLSAEKDLPATYNIRGIPGAIIPFKVSSLNIGQPPISWDIEMANTRDIAEQRFAVPDFGIGEKGFDAAKKKSNDKTATETQYLAMFTNTMVDYKNRTFRRQLGKFYNLLWTILYQYDEDLEYFHEKEYKKLDKKIRDKVKSLRPSGSATSWNTDKRRALAFQRKQIFQGSPYVKQWELDKMLMELDEPGLVDRLYQEPGEAEADQLETQAKEIPAILHGLPIRVKPSDDHAIHAQVVMQFLLQGAARNVQADNAGQQQLLSHLQGHMQALQEIDSKKARDLWSQFQKASASQIAMQQQQVE